MAMDDERVGGSVNWGVMILMLLLLGVVRCGADDQLPDSTLSAASFTVGASLGTSQKWLSENGTFTMGFHPIPATSTSLYLGVWYSGVSQIVPVWLANRERAAKPGASLTLTNAGSLVLSDTDGTQIWSSNTTAAGVVSGWFLENGNIVLRNASGATLWDSFDYPTDTFLPGLTVQVGHKFTAWKANDDPASGLYTFQMTTSGELHFAWNGTRVYYNSGPWEGSHFANAPQLGRTTPPDVFHFDNVSTGSPRFWYTTSGRNVTADITLKRFRLNPDGVARQHIWVIGSNSWQTFISAPVEPCDAHRVCGSNSMCTSSNYIPGCACLPGFEPLSAAQWSDQDYWLQGCGRDPLLDRCYTVVTVNATGPDSFQPVTDAIIDESSDDPQTFFNDTESICRARCELNCSCGGYSFSTTYPNSLTNCTLHSKSAVIYNARRSDSNTSSDSTTPPSFLVKYQSIPSQRLDDSSSNSSFTGPKLIVTVVLLSAMVATVMAILTWWVVTSKRTAAMDFTAVGLLRFSYKDLVDATRSFSKQLGSGGFGAVYKGTLADASEVAVKTLAKLRHGEQEFRTEVAVIGTVQHINLVRLRGFCAEGDHRALVYEYIPNGSLERHLFAKPGKPDHTTDVMADWKTRMTIALGAARAISYLHHECRSNIIHCDIKPENILLTADFTPKVSDFGLAKLIGKDVSRVITTVRGTRGYLAPEWLTNCTLTSKADVYSFGMTLLELIAGRRTVDLSYPSEKWFYAVWAFKEMARGENVVSLVDERLSKESLDEEEVGRSLQVGLWCTQDDPVKRPSMSDVVKMLEGTVVVVNAPAPPSYIAQTDEDDGDDAKIRDGGDGCSDMKVSFDYTQTFSAR